MNKIEPLVTVPDDNHTYCLKNSSAIMYGAIKTRKDPKIKEDRWNGQISILEKRFTTWKNGGRVGIFFNPFI